MVFGMVMVMLIILGMVMVLVTRKLQDESIDVDYDGCRDSEKSVMV